MSRWKRRSDGLEYTSRSGRHYWWLRLVNDWREWLPGRRAMYHWRNFHLAYLHVEDDPCTAGWSVDCVLLGLGFHLRYTDQLIFETTEIAQRVADIKNRSEWRELG